MVSVISCPLICAPVAEEQAVVKVLCNGTPCTIRPATKYDYPELLKLVPLVSRCPSTHDDDMLNEVFSNPWYHPYVVVRDDIGQIVTFGELLRLPHMGRAYDARLERVVTREEFRRNGAATKLCQFMVALASRLRCGRIDLTVENPTARRIYANLGFESVKTEVQRVMLTKENMEKVDDDFKSHFK
ncbi:MAG: hypothetical protein KVP17_000689 [Porospora cf. gigantea B]|uniref:uncharacterized protein n=1 Tax=Porospora cf. gigantea B TaxID=2853592 RepID=UPI003571F401|nr:MAG: hypothetical protein KVP17_000689 [Porospora cf. gigantea B]